jgi:hypothetical protein
MVKELSQATNQYEAHSKQSNISWLWMDHMGVRNLYFVSNPMRLLDINIKSMDVKWMWKRHLYLQYHIPLLFNISNCWICHTKLLGSCSLAYVVQSFLYTHCLTHLLFHFQPKEFSY